jgi:diguanylate cyclase (GGDEF)-like protein
MRPGLTAKLSILLACIGILASGITGYYAYATNRSLLVGEAERNLLTSTQLLSRRLSSAIKNIADETLTLAYMPSAAMVASLNQDVTTQEGMGRLSQVFATLMRIHPEYLQVRLISRQQHGLEVIRFDRDGQHTIRVEGNRLQEKGHFPYVFETLSLAPGRIYISPITVNHELGAHSAVGKPTLRLATPVATTSGTVVGVVVINVDLDSVLKLLQTDLPAGHQLYLTNEWGDFLVHPDPAMTFGFDKGRRIFMQDSFDETKALFKKTKSSILVNALDDPQQAKGQILAFVRKPLGLPEGHQFVVLGLGRPLADVLSGGKSLGQSIIQMVLAFSALAILLAIVFARALTRPLQMLTHAATSFASKHTLEALPLKRTDEIGVLARCFDQMRQEVKTHMDGLYRSHQELTHLARHDDLTGLSNRMQFFQRLELAIADVTSDEQIAVLFIDLDYFKQINDQLGHAVGDQVLITVARRLKHVLRSEDVVARLGGDEFIVLIKGRNIRATVPDIAEKILNSLNQVLIIGSHHVQIGASMGISLFPNDGSTAEELVLHADSAMYGAKSAGRHNFMWYHGADENPMLAAAPPAEGDLAGSVIPVPGRQMLDEPGNDVP